MKRRLTTLFSAGLLSLASAAGCASSEVAPDKVAAPKERIAAAEEAGAEEHPSASLQLKLANDQYDQAKRLIRDGEGERAEKVLQRAAVDAELALELARLENTRRDANEAIKRIEDLRKEHRLLTTD